MTAPISPIFRPGDVPAPRYIFVYGTLAPGRGPPHVQAVTNHLKPVGPAVVRGRMYCLGAYPAMLLDDGSDGGKLGWGDVHGMLMELPQEHEASYEKVIGTLDEWEDYDARNHEAENNEYLRLVVNAVKTEDGVEVSTFVYHYNFPMDETAIWVASGKWEPKNPTWVDEVEGETSCCHQA